MSAGFGAGFAALGVLVALLVIAVLLGAVALLRHLLDESRASARRAAGYATLALYAAALLVGGFGVAALVDEVHEVALLLVLTAFLPAGASVALLSRELDVVPAVVVSPVAWTLPHVAGVLVFFLVVAGVPDALSLSQGQVRTYGVAWIAVAVAGLVALGGTVLLAHRVVARVVGRTA